MTVESEREMDNKDIAEVELTGCQGKGERRARMAASFVLWLLEGPPCRPLPPCDQLCILLPYREAPQGCRGCGFPALNVAHYPLLDWSGTLGMEPGLGLDRGVRGCL